jgi:hypothetical protein
MPPSEAVAKFFEAVRAAEEEAEYTLSPGGPPGTPLGVPFVSFVYERLVTA